MLLCSPKGLMPSALKANHTFLGSFANSSQYFLSIFLHCDPSAGALNFPSFLRSSLCYRINLACSLFPNSRFNRGIIGAYHITFAGTLFLGGSPSTSPGSSRLILIISQCTAYRACVQILVRTAVENAVIRACMYLLHLQS